MSVSVVFPDPRPSKLANLGARVTKKMVKRGEIHWARWHMSVILAFWEAEALVLGQNTQHAQITGEGVYSNSQW